MRNISQLLFEDNVIRAGGPGQQVHKKNDNQECSEGQLHC